MPKLEEKVAAILRLRLEGKTESEIAESSDFDEQQIREAESAAFDKIWDAVYSGSRGLEEISRETRLPNFAVSIYSSQHGIDIYSDHFKRSSYLSRQQRKEAISFAVEEGAISDEIIAGLVGLSKSTVKQYRSPNSGKIRRKPGESVRAIRQAIRGGANSVEKVAETVGLVNSTTYQYICNKKIHVPRDFTYKGKMYRQRFESSRKLKILQRALSQGVNSLEELCKRTNLKPVGLWRFCNENSLTLPSDLIPFKYEPELDVLVEQGISLPEMGERTKCTREMARQYINYSGQYNLWRAAREEAKKAHRNEIIKGQEIYIQLYIQLLSVLEARTSQLAQNESWAVQMTLKHKASVQSIPSNVPYQKILKLFERYEKAQRRGKKVSLEELGKGLIPYASVGRILGRVGIEPMYGSIPYSPRYSKEKKRSLERLAQIGMPNIDIAYFVDLPEHLPRQYFTRKNTKNTAEAFIFNNQLTYRLASQIYEAQDLGFTPNEIVQLLNAREKVVDFAIENRQKIGRTIIRALRIAYHDRKYDKPYKMAA